MRTQAFGALMTAAGFVGGIPPAKAQNASSSFCATQLAPLGGVARISPEGQIAGAWAEILLHESPIGDREVAWLATLESGGDPFAPNPGLFEPAVGEALGSLKALVQELIDSKQISAPEIHRQLLIRFQELVGRSSEVRRLDQELREERSSVATPFVELRGHTAQLYSASLSPDGKRVVTASLDGTAKVWNLRGGLETTLRHSEGVHSALFSPDGATILTANGGAGASLWSVSGELLHKFNANLLSVRSASFSPDGAQIMMDDGFRPRIWNVDGTHAVEIGCSSGNASFSPDGTQIITVCVDGQGSVRVWNRDGTLAVLLRGEGARVYSASFSPDGRHILTNSADERPRIWNRSGELLAVLAGHTSEVYASSFSRDGSRIVTASADRTARIWAVDGTHLATIREDSDQIRRAVFTPDGNRVVTLSMKGRARIWSVNGGLLGTLSGDAKVTSIAFSPGGEKLVTVYGDMNVSNKCFAPRLWNLDFLFANSFFEVAR